MKNLINTRVIRLLAALLFAALVVHPISADAGQPEPGWETIQIKGKSGGTELKHTRDSGSGAIHLTWLPARQNPLCLVRIHEAKGPASPQGEVVVRSSGTILAIENKQPLHLEYLKKKLGLKGGYYVVRIEYDLGSYASNWQVIEIKKRFWLWD